MYELIYAGSDVEALVKGKYPDAKLTDASDIIHPDRFECEIDGIEDEEFYIFAIRQGFAECCLCFQFKMRTEPQGSFRKLWDWIAEADALNESEQAG